MLHLILKGHPNIAALNDEIKIEPLFTKGVSTFTFGNNSPEEDKFGVSILFDALTSISSNKNTTTLGVKSACNCVKSALAFVNSLNTYMKNLKVIITVRNDLVDQYACFLHAQKTGVYHSWNKGFENMKIQKIRIDKNLFARYVIDCLDTYVVLKELSKTHDLLQCVYEDYLVDPKSVHNKIFNFIDVPQIEVTWLKSKKIEPDPDKYITNYPEMKDLLKQIQSQYENGEIERLRSVYTQNSLLPIKRLINWIFKNIRPQ